MKKFRVDFKLLRNILLFVAFVVIIFSFGYAFGLSGYRITAKTFPKVSISREIPSDKEDLDFSLFWRVWDTVHAKYYDESKVIDSEMVYGAIKGMVAAVGDPYTIFLAPSENKVVQEDLQGTFEGVGIQIGFKGNQLSVMSPLPKSPAEEAGVKAGDFIIGIKDVAKDLDIGTSGITLPGAVQAIRGPAGTKVTLTLLRDGVDDPLEIDVVREAIDVPSIAIDYVGENEDIAHAKILKFSGETLTEWEDIVVEILTRPDLKGVVVDVRNNPGGFLQGSVELASDFLESGEVVTIEEAGDGVINEYRVEKLGRLRAIETIVLVNAGSASASEIFAGALKDHGRARLVGDTTFGKGTIQEPQQINNGTGLHITIARWLTPSGFWVDEGGLKPDIEIEDDSETDEDEQLLKAIELLE